MNGKTARLLNKFATENQYNHKHVKRNWVATPKDKRAKLRKQIQKSLEK